MTQNRQITLESYVSGMPQADNFSTAENAAKEPGDGEFLIRNLYFSLEPAIRGWLDGKANYMEPIPLGGTIRGPSVGRVIKSNNTDYNVGDIVFGVNQWEDYSICNASTILLEKLNPQEDTPLSYYIGPLGGSGATAYVGLHEIGHIQSGQTVVISAAAGATGNMAGQIAKLRGCRVIGIVGNDEKAQLIVEEFGFDAAINYNTTEDITSAVMKLAPDGVDIYFDNVGGPILNAMLCAMKVQARIVCCGMISNYNRTENPNPITNLWEMVSRQLTMQGFLLYTYQDKVPAAKVQLTQWISEGKIKVLEHVTEGIANTPAAFCELMSGKTIGKALVKLDLPED
jgi:NADPH-dependent curcumin reductase CurA